MAAEKFNEIAGSLFPLVLRGSNRYNHGSSTNIIHQQPPLSTVDQPEDIVEDEVASRAVGQELEGLGVVHGPLLIVDLDKRNARLVYAQGGSGYLLW